MSQACACAALEPTLRYQRGANGFLEYQTHANTLLRDAFAPLTSKFDPAFGLFLENLMQMGAAATACEIAVRENEKAEMAGRKLGTAPYGGRALDLNEAAVRAATRARRYLKEAMQELDDGTSVLVKSFGSEEARETLQLARRELFHELTEINIKPVDFEEVMKIWDEVTKAAESLDGLYSYFDDNIAQFITLRGEEDRGNRPHSPLPWWKYIVVAAIIGAGIFGVVACFVWFACSWLGPVLAAVAPWVFGIIDRGC